MNYVRDFTDGAIADNILRGLRLCSKSILVELKSNKLLTKNMIFPALDYGSLTYKGIETYADVTGLPLCYFFFGQNEPPTPTYTPMDGAMIKIFNSMTDRQLDAAINACDTFFPSKRPFFDDPDPNERFICCLNRLPYEKRLNNPIPSFKKMENDIHSVLQYRFSGTIGRNIRWFPTDLFPDLATYIGVSLHWIFGFKRHPLFCKNVKADNLFSRFTLLPTEQHKEFITMIKYISTGDLTEYYEIL